MTTHKQQRNGLQYVAKYERGHVQVFEGRRLRYLVTGFFHLTNSVHVETLHGPTPTGKERQRIQSRAYEAMANATAKAHREAA